MLHSNYATQVTWKSPSFDFTIGNHHRTHDLKNVSFLKKYHVHIQPTCGTILPVSRMLWWIIFTFFCNKFSFISIKKIKKLNATVNIFQRRIWRKKPTSTIENIVQCSYRRSHELQQEYTERAQLQKRVSRYCTHDSCFAFPSEWCMIQRDEIWISRARLIYVSFSGPFQILPFWFCFVLFGRNDLQSVVHRNYTLSPTHFKTAGAHLSLPRRKRDSALQDFTISMPFPSWRLDVQLLNLAYPELHFIYSLLINRCTIPQVILPFCVTLRLCLILITESCSHINFMLCTM